MKEIYLAKDDEFTWTFFHIDLTALLNGDKALWVDFKKLTSEHNDLNFLNAAAVIHVGERLQRQVVKRKVKKGTRNIKCRIDRCNRFLGLARCPEIMASKKKEKRKEKNQMLKVFQKELSELVAKAREQVNLQGEVPSRWSYVITPDVLDAAEEVGCEEYFDPIENQRFFDEDLKRIEADVRAQYPKVAEGVLQVLRKTKTDDHLSMISLSADEKGALYVTLVDPKGHHLKVEAAHFVEMIDSHEQTRRLHVFPPRGNREPVPFAFNSNTEGEIIGKCILEQMKFDIACCQSQGQLSNVFDRAWFYVDAEYLLCLWVVLCRLGQDRNRYTRLKSIAEANVAFDPFAAGVLL